MGFESLKGHRKLDAWLEVAPCQEQREYKMEGTHLLEIGACCGNLVDEILNGKDIIFAESLLDNGIVCERNALFVDLAVTTLVDQFTHGLQIRFAKEGISKRKENG